MLYLEMGMKHVRNGLHQGLSSFFYSEGSPHPMSRQLPRGGHCCHSEIQVGGFGGGLGDWEGEAGQGCWGVSACTQCLLAPALWAVGILSEHCLLTFLAPHSLRNRGHAFHTTPFASAQGWVQHLCRASTRCQLFLCISGSAEHRTILQYDPWCSQYFGFSDLRTNSDWS